jgi:beta-mannanase
MTQHGYTQYQGAKLCNDITNGVFDDALNNLAQYFNQYPNVKYLIRPDYEVSGNLHANTDESGFNPDTFDFEAYPAAYRHIHEVIGGQVSNAAFMYHPVRGSAEALYPGDDVVDYQGKFRISYPHPVY